MYSVYTLHFYKFYNRSPFLQVHFRIKEGVSGVLFSAEWLSRYWLYMKGIPRAHGATFGKKIWASNPYTAPVALAGTKVAQKWNFCMKVVELLFEELSNIPSWLKVTFRGDMWWRDVFSKNTTFGTWMRSGKPGPSYQKLAPCVAFVALGEF